ncbi:MAG TPA: DoxX family protein [Gemmatimonadales bacterium]
MLRTLFRTDDDRTLTLVRVVLGTVMFAHGAQKLLGWFGGFGAEATVGYFQQALGVPAGLAVLVIVAEFFGGLGLITGFLSRIGAAGVAAVMLGAVAMVHARIGFFMNWTGQQPGEGFEFHLLAVALALVILAKGAGAFSIDRWLASRMERAPVARAMNVRDARIAA